MSDGSQDRLYTRDEMMQARRRITDLEGAARADEERLRAAAERAGITYVGCDTPDALAERIAELEAALTSETAIVDRIWDLFGRPSYKELAGRSLYDLISGLQKELIEERVRLDAMAKHEWSVRFECIEKVWEVCSVLGDVITRRKTLRGALDAAREKRP